MKRDGPSRHEARASIAAQLLQWTKKRYADYIIENDTTEAELHLRVDELIGTLQKNAAENNAQPSCEA